MTCNGFLFQLGRIAADGTVVGSVLISFALLCWILIVYVGVRGRR